MMGGWLGAGLGRIFLGRNRGGSLRTIARGSSHLRLGASSDFRRKADDFRILRRNGRLHFGQCLLERVELSRQSLLRRRGGQVEVLLLGGLRLGRLRGFRGARAVALARATARSVYRFGQR
jgi:hypothetical protein